MDQTSNSTIKLLSSFLKLTSQRDVVTHGNYHVSKCYFGLTFERLITTTWVSRQGDRSLHKIYGTTTKFHPCARSQTNAHHMICITDPKIQWPHKKHKRGKMVLNPQEIYIVLIHRHYFSDKWRWCVHHSCQHGQSDRTAAWPSISNPYLTDSYALRQRQKWWCCVHHSC